MRGMHQGESWRGLQQSNNNCSRTEISSASLSVLVFPTLGSAAVTIYGFQTRYHSRNVECSWPFATQTSETGIARRERVVGLLESP